METFITTGTCCRQITFDIDGDKVCNIKFWGGCPGNTLGVAKLAEGRPITEVIELLEGIPCRNGTSCPDQLAKALKKYLGK